MNSRSDSDENIRYSDNLLSSSNLQVKDKKNAAKIAAVDDNIPPSHPHHHHEKSRMKKPDMPIYVPRGRRLAAECELPKLGEEKKVDRRPKKLESELDSEIQEGQSENLLLSEDQNSVFVSSEQGSIVHNGSTDTVSEAKAKSHGKKKTLKTVATDPISEESVGQKKARSGHKANGRQKKNLTGDRAQSMRSNDSVEAVVNDDSSGNYGISVTAASDMLKTNNCDELSSENSSQPNLTSLSADCDSNETLFTSAAAAAAAAAAGDASGMSATLLTTDYNALATDSDSVKQKQNLDHSAASCTEMVRTVNSLANENMSSCLGKLSRRDNASPRSNVGLAISNEQSWDALFDDTGEALHPNLMNQITESLGAINVQKPQFDYLNYQPKDPEIGEEEFEHLIEIYDFPSSLQTVDLVMAFKDFQATGFEIKWVDDTHAIGVFSGKTAASSALTTFHNPFIKVRPIQYAARQTKLKAKKCTEFLLPYKPRPVTVASVARLMVTKALGVSEPVSKEKREEERQKIKAAREQKRTSKRQKEDAWEGKIGKCAMDEI